MLQIGSLCTGSIAPFKIELAAGQTAVRLFVGSCASGRYGLRQHDSGGRRPAQVPGGAGDTRQGLAGGARLFVRIRNRGTWALVHGAQ